MLEDKKPKPSTSSYIHNTHQQHIKPKINESSSEEEKLKESEEEEEFTIDYIVKQRFSSELAIWQYLVKWEGYDSDANTWEPKENIAHTPQFKRFTQKKSNSRKKRFNSQKIKKEESESSLSDLSSSSSESSEEKEIKLKDKGKGKLKVKSEDSSSSSSSSEPLMLHEKLVKKEELDHPFTRRPTRQSTSSQQRPTRQSTSSQQRPTRQSTASQRKPPRKATKQLKPATTLTKSSPTKPPKPEPIPTKESLQRLLQQNSRYDQTQDPLRNAQESVNWTSSPGTQFRLQDSSIVIWSERKGNQDEFETLSLWYCIENEGGKRVKYGFMNRRLQFNQSSIHLQSVKAHQVDQLFIHRNLLSDLAALKGLIELVKLPNYVVIYEFGNASDVSHDNQISRIQLIMTMSSVLIPNYNCMMKNITSTTNPFQIFRALQRENHHSQLLLHPITTQFLCQKIKSNQIKPKEKQAIFEILKDLEPDLVLINQESLNRSKFGIIKSFLEVDSDELEFNETEEIESIVESLNSIKQILFKDIRRFIILVDDTSNWLTCIDRENLNRINNVEVMSISEATECFANCSSLL
ncbi:hypothetical protein DFH28DRAFT_1224601 [Melampsora americana]|nr:hypothetical protein DFH28DRAFT_1224601 [Melampsora americana]